MRTVWPVVVVSVVVVVGCKKAPQPAKPPTPSVAPDSAVSATIDAPAPGAPSDAATVATPPADAATTDATTPARKPPAPAGAQKYLSDCSLTHPIARNPCADPNNAASTRGLKSCAALHVTSGDSCKTGAPSCYVEVTCPDGHNAPSDFLECADKQSDRCMTRSSRAFKQDIEYLTTDELDQLATQVEQLRLARYHYKDAPTGDVHIGLITEDAPGAPFITSDGRRVDLYSLLSASIAALQKQDARIRALEHDIQQCKHD